MKTSRIVFLVIGIILLAYLVVGVIYYNRAAHCYTVRHSQSNDPSSGNPNNPVGWFMNTLFWPLYLLGDAANQVGVYGCTSRISSGQSQTPSDTHQTDVFTHSATSTSERKDFTNSLAGYSLQYPSKLELLQSGAKITFTHSIPYKNSGACDMMGGGKTYNSLEDFDLSLEVINKPVQPVRTEGAFEAGRLKGIYVYEGAEACGHTVYYFRLSNNRTLVVTRVSIQALSSVVTDGVRNEVIKTPGVIVPEEANVIFKSILESFTLLNPDGRAANGAPAINNLSTKFPVIAFVTSSFTEAEKKEIQTKLLNPFSDFEKEYNTEPAEQIVSISVRRTEVADSKYDMEYISANGGNGGFVYGNKNESSLEWWVPDCMLICPFSKTYEQKYSQVVAAYRKGHPQP